jgi:hypothetical protein
MGSFKVPVPTDLRLQEMPLTAAYKGRAESTSIADARVAANRFAKAADKIIPWTAPNLRIRILDLQNGWISIYEQDDDLLLGNC